MRPRWARGDKVLAVLGEALIPSKVLRIRDTWRGKYEYLVAFTDPRPMSTLTLVRWVSEKNIFAPWSL